MTIEENIFKKSKLNKNKLLEYGFVNYNNEYEISKCILNNNFKIIVKIINNKPIGKVIDLEMNEEYTNFRVETTGEFSNNIRNEFEKYLIDIRNNCFTNTYFINNQSNRITELIKEKYNDLPEFLWADDTTTGVFRNKNNKKWYGIIMNIKKNKIALGDENVDVINVKLDPDKILKLLETPGYYKAYHMNKKYWITIILDETLSDDEIIKNIEESYNYTKGKK
jgi:predicted DNA-binding protein (MmcQ/YjbR family)